MQFEEWNAGPYAERLLKLADFLDNVVPKERWDFSTVFNSNSQPLGAIIDKARNPDAFECGSVGCALGWTPKCFPNELDYNIDQKHLYALEIIPKDPAIKIETSVWATKTFRTAHWFFGLTKNEADGLFDIGSVSKTSFNFGVFEKVDWENEPQLMRTSTKEHVAAKLREFVRLKSEGKLEPVKV